jgi:hypothetical protein
MAPFPFLSRGNPAQYAKGMVLASYTPSLSLEELVTGVDNVRHDVLLSPRFAELARQHIFRLLVKYGNAEPLVAELPVTTFRPPSVVVPTAKEKSKPADAGEFKRQMADLLCGALNRSKAEDNISIDMLARVAVLKFLRLELAAQFAAVLERSRANLKGYENPRLANPAKAVQLREIFWQLQVEKKAVLRKAGQDLLQTCREVEKETLARLRRSLFGDSLTAHYQLFLNRLVFTEDGRDDYLNAEHYVMMGNFQRDPDRYDLMVPLAAGFLRSLGIAGFDQDDAIDAALCAPDNAQEVLGAGVPDENSEKGRLQKALLGEWVSTLEHAGVMRPVMAAYEVVPLLAQYSPPINAQQLKNALIERAECNRVEALLEEHGKISPDAMYAAIKRVAFCRGSERAKLAGRFFRDLMRYHRDLRRLDALQSAMDSVNLISSDKLQSLSSVNHTLYEFLLSEEQKRAGDRVAHHVVLKADVRDSTTLTRTLLERGLNPASHFSLNFYEPVNKLLPIYGAVKVFIEGDAVILALFEHEGEPGFGVARTCVLAKEILEIVRAYNEHSRRAGLPILELGIGISYQDSPPLYLMDGGTRIMISKALNQSDRLSSSSKLARKMVGENKTLFNVYTFQTVAHAQDGDDPDEFLVRYNLGGIHINQDAFRKLQQEISLRPVKLELPTIWKSEAAVFHAGAVTLPSGGLHRLVVREACVPSIEPGDFSLKSWTDRRYFEVCTNPAVYELVERNSAARTVATH